jgi:choice-of-anchor A domain-containing protein
MKTVKYLSGLSILAISSAPVIASAASRDCPLLAPSDYLVFSLGDIDAFSNDFNGPTGAVGSITLRDGFAIDNRSDEKCVAAVAGGHFSLSDGGVTGGRIESRYEPTLVDAGLEGNKITSSGNVGALPTTAQFFKDKSESLKDRPTTPGSKVFENDIGWKVIEASEPVTIVHVKSSDLSGQNLEFYKPEFLELPANSKLVINVDASDNGGVAMLHGKNMHFDGFTPGQIILNFHNATKVDIAHDGNSTQRWNGQPYGIATTILAPYADVTGHDAHITGGIYAAHVGGSLQVDYAKTDWPEDAPTPTPPALAANPKGFCPSPSTATVTIDCATLHDIIGSILGSNQWCAPPKGPQASLKVGISQSIIQASPQHQQQSHGTALSDKEITELEEQYQQYCERRY